MSLKILVINPYVTDFKLYDEWMHPAGLYFLMDILEKNGHIVSYFNCLHSYSASPRKYGTGSFNFSEISKPELYSNIKRKFKIYGKPVQEFRSFLQNIPQPDLICIGSMMTYWATGVVETIKIIRETNLSTLILVGGIAARLMPNFFNRPSDNCISGNLSDPEISSLLEIKELPEPSLLAGFKALDKPVNHGPVLLTLGCPMQCSYCASKILQPSFQYRSLELILKEIDFLVDRFGITDFAFYDDALLCNPQRVFIPFLEKIIERKYDIRFHTPNGMHLRFINEPLLDLMIKAGFTTFRFGYESSDLRYLQDISAKVNRDELEDKIKLLKRYCTDKQDVGVYIMGGLREQTPQQMLNEMDFVGAQGIKVKPVFISPVPGTSLYQYYLDLFPALATDPLWHNDSFFITCLPYWSTSDVENVRRRAKEINCSV